MNTYVWLVVVALFFTASETYAFSGSGTGTAGNPFQITTCDQLQEMSDDLGASYQLQNNIDCTATAGWNGGAGFFPVGRASAQFTGNFNGRNFIIDGLYIERADDVYGENPDDDIDEDNVGLFGFVNGSLIRNVTLINAYVKGYRYVGGVIGEAQNSTLENLHVNVATAVDPQNDCDPKACIWARYGAAGGGVVGGLTNSEATRLTSGGAVKGSGNIIGGVVGGMTDSNLTYATSTARIDGGHYIGGLVGTMDGNSDVSYGVATGDVVGYEAEEVAKNGDAIGGLVGNAQGVAIEITNSSATGDVSGARFVGGLIGYFQDGTIEDSFATGDVTASSTMAGGLVGYMTEVTIEDAYATGDVAGYTQVGGLIGWMRDASLTDVYATGEVTAADLYAGGLVGVMDASVIADAYATGEVTATAGLGGGFVAVMGTSSSATDSYAAGDVTGAGGNGGFVAAACGGSTITESYATGNVSGNAYVGGFLGLDCDSSFGLSGGATLDQVFATGDVDAVDEHAGGFASRVTHTTITNAYAAGRVTAPTLVGGFATEFNLSTTSYIYARGDSPLPPGPIMVGGLVINKTDASITNAFWDAEATEIPYDPLIMGIGIGLANADMRSRATYVDDGWDFATIWGMNSTDNDNYPFLLFSGLDDDPAYSSPDDLTEPSSGGGGGGGGSSKKKVTTAAPVSTTASTTATTSGAVSDEIRNLILKNRALFEVAMKAGITLPAYIKNILDASTMTTVLTGLPVRDLTIGIRGEDVQALQQLLIAAGYAIPAAATGLFGPQTQAALAAYQTKAGLMPAQGYFGPKTRAQMKSVGLSGLWW